MASSKDKKQESKKICDYTDAELMQHILDSVAIGHNYRKQLRNEYPTLLRVINLFSSDKDFLERYEKILATRISEMEENLLTGSFFDNIPQKVDKLGNVDLSAGYLRQAELKAKTAQWILERRNKAYQAKSQQDITSNGQALGCVVIPAKESSDE